MTTLGGYKFAGRYCQKGSLTDAEWKLLVHKTKVAAFMAANTLANAGWDYYMTGSPDGNYHCMDSAGNNYVTCFYNSTTGTYFAIYTLTSFKNSSGNSSSAVGVSLYTYTPSLTTYHLGIYNSHFVIIGTSPITYDSNLYSIGGNSDQSLKVVPVGNLTASPSYSSNTTTGNYLSSTENYYGFAVKGDCIESFSGDSISKICCTIASGHGFSSFVNQSDSFGMYAWNMQSYSNSSSAYENLRRNLSYSAKGIYAELFACRNQSNYTGTANVCVIPMARFASGTTPEYPYQSISVCNLYNGTSNVTGKGVVDVSQVAVNFSVSGTVPTSTWGTCANGNYICVRSHSNSTSNSQYAFGPMNKETMDYSSLSIYFGWDASNPDITQASAWTEYTGA